MCCPKCSGTADVAPTSLGLEEGYDPGPGGLFSQTPDYLPVASSSESLPPRGRQVFARKVDWRRAAV